MLKNKTIKKGVLIRMKKCSLFLLMIVLALFLTNKGEAYAKESSFGKQKVQGVMTTAVSTDIVISWEKIGQATGYVVFESTEQTGTYKEVARVSSCRKTLKNRQRGKTYYYKIQPYKVSKGKTTYGKKSTAVSATVATGKSVTTVKTFLQTAIAPVGSTMYIWGGGWNKADTAAGKDAKRIGLNPQWRTFFNKQKKGYDYKRTKYQWGNGLDCSGYVGWTFYNILNKTPNKSGYVKKANKQASWFAGMGYGKLTKRNQVNNYRPGDIMSSACTCCGHVYIVIGQCKDGSVVLVHSSPTGVQINGTVTQEGNKNSEAVKLAKKYMKQYYGSWYKKYPKCDKGVSYLQHYEQMRWHVGEDCFMSDPHGYADMDAKTVLKDLFEK